MCRATESHVETHSSIALHDQRRITKIRVRTMQNAPIVTIFGGSGFVGRYIAQRMARAGWRVRVAVRRPNDAIFVQTYGVVGQVTAVQANIRDDASVSAALAGAEAVVNCVGILAESGKQEFDAVHAEGAARIAHLAKASGVARMVHISAIGADADSESEYAQSKAEGEAGVLAAYPDAMILRPSIIFGTEDEFFNRFAEMTRLSPVVPLVGAETKFQPVYVVDIAAAAEMGATGQASGTYELGGPEVESFSELMTRMLTVIRRRRLILPLPTFVGNIMASVTGAVEFLSGGLIPAAITKDQIKQLGRDNVVSADAKGFADLGIRPTAMGAVLESYLYCYRPYGQYTELTESARDIKG